MKMTDLQKEIVELLTKNKGTLELEKVLTCDEIAFELKRNKMHIGNSVKSLVKKGILRKYKSCEESNPKYFYFE